MPEHRPRIHPLLETDRAKRVALESPYLSALIMAAQQAVRHGDDPLAVVIESSITMADQLVRTTRALTRAAAYYPGDISALFDPDAR